MSTEFVESKVREIIADQLGLSEEDIQLEAEIVSDLGADVLDFMELIMAFEEEFEVEIDDNEAEGLKTVQDVVSFLSTRS